MKNFLKQLTEEAGEKLKENFKKGQSFVALRKTSKEAAIKYDKTSDKFIVEKIRKKYPDHNILSEEGGFKKGNSDYLWIVDSLDGTGNFANHNPLFSVCIALFKKKTPFLAATFAPMINEFYFAEKGKGAFLNSKKINVSKIKELKESYLFYCEGNEKNKLRTRKILNALYPKVIDIRKIGSAGIETAWVATGRGEAFWATQIDPWDIAAGFLLIKEAGGEIIDFKGKPWKMKKSDLLFANKKVSNEILKLIKNI